jgi:glycosyltransferase involved in cell wall biosynthesis
MRTVFTCFYQAYPPASGAASVSFNLAKHLTGRKWLIQLSDEDRHEDIDGTMTVVSLKDKCRTKHEKLKGLRSRISRIADEIGRLDPDLVVFEGASWTVYFALLHRELRGRGIRAKVVYHSHNVEYLLRKQKHGWPIVSLTRRAERFLLTHCDLCTAVSEVDAAQFESLYGIRPEVLPNGVDVDRFDGVDEAAVNWIREKYRLPDHAVLFMGLMGYKPNDEAVAFLIRDVFPCLRNICPQAKLVIIGGDVAVQLHWLINPGSIPADDLPAFVKACDVCVAPIFSGSGTRLKILEYMAAKRPVVSTRKGAEGLNVTDGKELMYAEEPAEYAECIGALLKDAERGRQIGSRAYDAVCSRYGWPTIVRCFEARLQQCTNQ